MLFSINLFSTLILVLIPGTNALWPKPTTFTNGSTPLRLASSFSISAVFEGVPADVNSAISRTEGYLKNDQLDRLVPGRGASDAHVVAQATQLTSLKLQLTSNSSLNANGTVLSITQEAQKPVGERDEAYSLSIPASGGTATISANSTLGLLRGLTTFSQMWYTFDGTIYSLSAPVYIKDEPAFVRFFVPEVDRHGQKAHEHRV